MGDKKTREMREQYHLPPPEMTGWESFSTFLYNSETGQFLGRTGSSWGKHPATTFCAVHSKCFDFVHAKLRPFFAHSLLLIDLLSLEFRRDSHSTLNQ